MPTVGTTSRPGYVYDQGTDTWIPIGVGPHSHDTDYVTKSTIDAKGDLLAGSANDTVSRLAIGNNGETLVADSSTSQGLRWQGNFAAGKNKIINGDMNIWQRGTSITIPSGAWTYHCDRWSAYETYSAGSLVVSRQTFTPGTAPVAGYEGNYFMRFTAPTTGTGGLNFRQLIENVTTFAGQTVTVSFWAKASSALTLYSFASQRFGSGGSADVDSGSNPHSITTSWTRFSYSWTLPSIAGKTIGTGSALDAYFYTSANFTAGATLDIWGVQLEAGSVATAFQTATGTLAGELAACQRYYWRQVSGTTYGVVCTSGIMESTTGGSFVIQLPVPMRVAPTSIDTSNLRITDLHTTNSPASSFTLSDKNELFVIVRANASGLTANRPAWLTANNSGASYLGLSAEL